MHCAQEAMGSLTGCIAGLSAARIQSNPQSSISPWGQGDYTDLQPKNIPKIDPKVPCLDGGQIPVSRA